MLDLPKRTFDNMGGGGSGLGGKDYGLAAGQAST